MTDDPGVRIFNENEHLFTSSYDNIVREQIQDAVKRAYMAVAAVEDAAIEAALIARGWTPPDTGFKTTADDVRGAATRLEQTRIANLIYAYADHEDERLERDAGGLIGNWIGGIREGALLAAGVHPTFPVTRP